MTITIVASLPGSLALNDYEKISFTYIIWASKYLSSKKYYYVIEGGILYWANKPPFHVHATSSKFWKTIGSRTSHPLKFQRISFFLESVRSREHIHEMWIYLALYGVGGDIQ